jgi:peptide/nickel transport system ATP-binding protein
MSDNQPILQIRNLSIEYLVESEIVRAVSHVDLDIKRGEVLCLVGESGCGKSTLGLSILRLLPKSARISPEASILFNGEDLLRIPIDRLRQVRGKHISVIFQDPMTALNPVETIYDHLLETLKAHEGRVNQREALSRMEDALSAVGIGRDRLYDYPHQLSGGMRQRVMIALSLLLDPDLIIADEPTTSLDVLVEAQILDIIGSLKKKRNLSLLFITHNFGVVAQIADRVAVMYGGEIVEVGDVVNTFKLPLHPYTQVLMDSVPNIEKYWCKITALPGSAPDLSGPAEEACSFRMRCPYAFERCFKRKPHLKSAADGRLVSCHLRS